MTKRVFIIAVPMVLLLTACKSDTEVPPLDRGLDYFPIEVGTWVEYQVDSMWRYDDIGVHDSLSYRLLERIDEHYIDPAGRPAQRIVRYVQDADGQWIPRDVWMSTRNDQYAERLEENLRMMKLAFPLSAQREWDVHVHNTDAPLIVVVDEIDVPWSADGVAFEHTLYLRNKLPPNFIETRDLAERYARGVGLVHKRWTELETQPTYDQEGNIIGFSISGFDLRMRAVAHGTN